MDCCSRHNRAAADKPPYLTRIEGPPPKRNVVSSSLAGGAKKRCDLCHNRLQRFAYILVNFIFLL